MTCVDCRHLDLRATQKASQESRHHDYAKLGMFICGGKSHGPATFVTNYKARNGEMFVKAADEQIEKRVLWLKEKQK